jgi:hypothetical protein
VSFRPLSQRETRTPAFDGPHEGMPAWMLQSARQWVKPFLTDGRGSAVASTLQSLEVALRTAPLSWASPEHALDSLFTRMWEDEEFALNVLDYALHFCPRDGARATDLNVILYQAGSVWEVQPAVEGAGCQLARRAIGPLPEVIEEVRNVNQRAHAHLLSAWGKLMGRDPDPSGAYREAIRAVEVVAAPVVTPDDPKATLGKIIPAIRAKPEKWTVDLVEATPTQVADTAAMIWQGQFDRHGTADENVPLNVSQEQADAAVHVSIALVRLFAGGHIRPV